MNPEPGLRERKKQRTRETIARAAHELFAERGYHATTLPDIAEAADVSTRTIFAYFPSKEDILFSDFPVMKEALAQALAERPEGQDGGGAGRRSPDHHHHVAARPGPHGRPHGRSGLVRGAGRHLPLRGGGLSAERRLASPRASPEG